MPTRTSRQTLPRAVTLLAAATAAYLLPVIAWADMAPIPDEGADRASVIPELMGLFIACVVISILIVLMIIRRNGRRR